jgi:hypothetical protein
MTIYGYLKGRTVGVLEEILKKESHHILPFDPERGLKHLIFSSLIELESSAWWRVIVDVSIRDMVETPPPTPGLYEIEGAKGEADTSHFGDRTYIDLHVVGKPEAAVRLYRAMRRGDAQPMESWPMPKTSPGP